MSDKDANDRVVRQEKVSERQLPGQQQPDVQRAASAEIVGCAGPPPEAAGEPAEADIGTVRTNRGRSPQARRDAGLR